MAAEIFVVNWNPGKNISQDAIEYYSEKYDLSKNGHQFLHKPGKDSQGKRTGRFKMDSENNLIER